MQIEHVPRHPAIRSRASSPHTSEVCRHIETFRRSEPLVVAALTASTGLTASQASSDNDVSLRISKLKAGDGVTLVLRDGSRVTGRVFGGTADAVIMTW